jgi:xanthine dehydrogenase molybdopterin-binding subunit B
LVFRDTETGKLLTDGPSHYQLPTVADLPRELNVTLLENSNPGRQSAIYSSKAQCSVPFYQFSEEISRTKALRFEFLPVARQRSWADFLLINQKCKEGGGGGLA